MDREWVLSQLERQLDLTNEWLEAQAATMFSVTGGSRGDLTRLQDAERSLIEGNIRMQEIFDRLQPGEWPDDSVNLNSNLVTLIATRVTQLLARLKQEHEIAARLGPAMPSPELRADELHPWIWQSAQSLWSTGHYADAVETAAKQINAELQNKLGRRDISDMKLCSEAFSLTPSAEGSPRLRMPGDRSSETWKARQEGALAFGRGCYMAIRNPLAHAGQPDLGEHEALEQLCAFSLLARWIEACDVEEAS